MEWLWWRKRDQAVEGIPKVSMYTLSTCPSCNKAKKFFTERRIPFQFINYDLADQATQDSIMREIEAEELQAFPFVRIGDQTVQGYDPKRYAKLLGIDASSKAQPALNKLPPAV
jgi:glutaredoxin